MISTNRREGEPASAVVFRFTKKVRRSGVLIEARRRRFKTRTVSKRARKISAIYRAEKKDEMSRAKKLGITVS